MYNDMYQSLPCQEHFHCPRNPLCTACPSLPSPIPGNHSFFYCFHSFGALEPHSMQPFLIGFFHLIMCISCSFAPFHGFIARFFFESFSCGSAGKESTCNAGDPGLAPGWGRSLGEGKGYTLQYSGLENSMDCIVHRVPKSQTQLSSFHFNSFLALINILLSACTTVQLSIHPLKGILVASKFRQL